MIDIQNIGYVICETATTSKESVIVDEKNDRIIIETILQDTNIKNRNGRFYPDSEMEPELKCSRMNELLSTGNLCGEAGHPTSKDIARQQTIDPNNISHKILKLWKEGNDIKAWVKGTPNDKGDNFNRYILEGSKPSFSLRALGTVHNTSRGAEVRNIKIITWDWVIYPSHKRAYMQKIVNESTLYENKSNNLFLKDNDKGLIVPITNDKVIKAITNESTNVNSILESFNTLYDSITILENGRRVQLNDKLGHIFIINLENYVQDQIMNYCSTFK